MNGQVRGDWLPKNCTMILYLFVFSLLKLLQGALPLKVRSSNIRKQTWLAAAPVREGRIVVPPNDIKSDRGGSNEYGIRQLTVSELNSYIGKVRKKMKMKVPAGTLNLEMFEMLESLEIIANALNSKNHPHSKELLAFGDFKDGEIESCAAMRLIKGFPYEMDIYVVLNFPHMSQESTSNLILYIDEMSKENAILVNFKPLKIFSSLKNSLNMVKPNVYDEEVAAAGEKGEKGNSAVVDSNKERFLVVLDTIPLVDLGRFWYQVDIPHVKTVYIKQKLECLNEFYVRRIKPTSVGGGLLILDASNSGSIFPEATKEYFETLARELEHKSPKLNLL